MMKSMIFSDKLKLKLNFYKQWLQYLFRFHYFWMFIFLLQFEGQEINIDLRVGIFITMNPGYAGRTELPESVKALFRPVVVIVPDLQQICEIMLFSEGFLLAKVSVKENSKHHCGFSTPALFISSFDFYS